MSGTMVWNNTGLPWQDLNLPYKEDTVMPWNNVNLPWKQRPSGDPSESSGTSGPVGLTLLIMADRS